jgi:prolyl oligopeptidase
MTAPNPADGSNDPYVWLEEIEGEKAVAWVEAQNARTDGFLCDDSYKRDFDAVMKILDADDRIPFVGKSGDYLYNFWKDAAHPRGLWRRTVLESYKTDTPEWDVLLDIDALNQAEGISWAFAGAARSPDKTRALISLSFNGTDAIEVREFDIPSKSFVADGFIIPKGQDAGELGRSGHAAARQRADARGQHRGRLYPHRTQMDARHTVGCG